MNRDRVRAFRRVTLSLLAIGTLLLALQSLLPPSPLISQQNLSPQPWAQ